MKDNDYEAGNIINLLYNISNSLSTNNDIKDVIKPVLNIMLQNLQVIRGMITIFNRQSGEIFIEDGFGFSDEAQTRSRYTPGEGVTGRVVESGLPIVIENIEKSDILANKTGFKNNYHDNQISFICVPIRSTNHTTGTISAYKILKDSGQLETDTKLLSIVATMISRVIRLHQNVHEENMLLLAENRRLYEALSEKKSHSKIIGNSNAIRMVLEMIGKIVNTSTTVLILGESGVGKERVAETIHFNSSRKDKPFIKFNCGALPENLIESELFGYEKGAFTGATTSRIGKFQQADKGTLFLDEVGELSLNAQTKLLRVIQEKELERIGGTQTHTVNIRIIAATNRDLSDRVNQGLFREDLFYRLNVFPITVPPLRERKTDIPLLTDFFIKSLSKKLNKDKVTISRAAMDLMVNYSWPGNVRELENCIERALILCDNSTIRIHNLPLNIQDSGTHNNHFSGPLQNQIDNIEYEIIIQELAQNHGNVSVTAQKLGLTVRKMGLRIKKHGINPNRFKKR
ncbi:MAG TPA: sigma 54-interacting transcriptional regulator [Spirochaetota bacterium]|nr:sigma 54-interacting transcriptional regulator [Spirochaetota bacterium]